MARETSNTRLYANNTSLGNTSGSNTGPNGDKFEAGRLNSKRSFRDEGDMVEHGEFIDPNGGAQSPFTADHREVGKVTTLALDNSMKNIQKRPSASDESTSKLILL